MSKGRILVIEDDEAIVRLLEVALQDRGYTVVCATHGSEALATCRASLPDLIILDVRLPDMSGYDVGKALRASRQTRHIPIIILTAYGERRDRLIALDELKAQYFLNKPFDIEELAAIIEGQLRERRRTNQYHPVTGLPTADIVAEQLRTLLAAEGWTAVVARLNGFDDFSHSYGMVSGEQALRFTANLIREVVEQCGAVDAFVGQLAIGPGFLLIDETTTLRRIAGMLVERFDHEIALHYDFRDRERGYVERILADGTPQQAPLMSLAIALLSERDGPFRDIREIGEAAEHLLQQSPAEQRSCIIIGRS